METLNNVQNLTLNFLAISVKLAKIPRGYFFLTRPVQIRPTDNCVIIQTLIHICIVPCSDDVLVKTKVCLNAP